MTLKNVLWTLLGVMLLIAGYSIVVEKPDGSTRDVPARLHGVWVTTNPDYSDRYLEIGRNFITFGTGGVNSKRFEVTGFEGYRDSDGRELDTIYFKDVDGSKFSRQLYLGLETGKQLTFKNQPEVVWVFQ